MVEILFNTMEFTHQVFSSHILYFKQSNINYYNYYYYYSSIHSNNIHLLILRKKLILTKFGRRLPYSVK